MGEIIQIGRYERPGRKINDRYRVFSKYGIAPCLNCCEGGNIMPFVIENEETLYADTDKLFETISRQGELPNNQSEGK